MDEREADAFFEGLTGRAGSQPAEPAAALGARLRSMVQRVEQEEGQRQAQAAKAGLSNEDQAAADRVWARLKAQGLVERPTPPGMAAAPAPAPSAAAASPRQPGWAGRIRDWLAGPAWQRGLAAGAFAAVCAVVAIQLLPGRGGDAEEDRMRGGADVVQDANPAARKEALKAAFEAAGATVPAAVQLSESPARWAMQVAVPAAGQLPAVNAVRKQAGLPPTQSLQFTVTITEPGKR